MQRVHGIGEDGYFDFWILKSIPVLAVTLCCLVYLSIVQLAGHRGIRTVGIGLEDVLARFGVRQIRRVE